MLLSPYENILHQLTGKSSLHNVTAAELQQVADKYPYYGAIQFLLAKKLFLDDDKTYKQAVQKAALHFSNTVWLHFNFVDDGDINEHTAIKNGADETINENEEDDNVHSDETGDLINERLSSLIKEQSEAFEKPIEEESVLPVQTTPFHRIDYFASQGIKLDAEKEPDDKLGSQLKRFTDWLKQMKKVNPNPADLGTDQNTENQVQQMAEHSNVSTEVITEAMAEVLINQNKLSDAIHVYEKLSFLNPSKSAYFAAKIGELKVKQ